MAASLVKTIEYPTIMTSTNPRTNHVTLLRWMFVEAGVVLITASIPCLRPLIVHWIKKFIKRAPTLHRKMDNAEGTQSTTLNVSQMTQDWKKRWIMPYMQQTESGENLEQHILASISTHIFAGDREFLDRHVPGIVKKVEVTVVADEIPLTEVEHT